MGKFSKYLNLIRKWIGDFYLINIFKFTILNHLIIIGPSSAYLGKLVIFRIESISNIGH